VTLSPTERAKLRQEWLAGIEAEADRRQAAKLEASGGDGREQLYRMLDLMHERRKMAPGYVEPDAATRAAQLRELDRWFAEHYGSGR
jgi:hypothetical protein